MEYLESNKSKFSHNEQRLNRRKLIQRVIILCICIIPLFIWIQSYLLSSKETSPFDSNILIFALININVLLVLFVLFLVLRNLAELLFEKRVSQIGRTLKAKLIASFLSLTLIPTILLFFVALQFVSTSMDYWFNSSIENSLEESLKLARSLLKDTEDQVTVMGKKITVQIHDQENQSYNNETVQKTLNEILQLNSFNGPDSLSIIAPDISVDVQVKGVALLASSLPKIPASIIQKIEKQNSTETVIQDIDAGDLVRSVSQIKLGPEKDQRAILVTSLLVKQERMDRMEAISKGIEGYRQLKYFKEPFKFWLLIILFIVTLLVVFAAIWFGIYIARGITEPIVQLVDATKRVADGDLEFKLGAETNDEMGMLINSFNQMTQNLYTSNDQLEKTYDALMTSSQESEQRRRYTEIILQNVSAGVISLDEKGHITTINRFAENLLKINKDHFIGLTFTQVLPSGQTEIVNGFVEELNDTGKTSLQQHIKLNVLGKSYSLLINFTRLEDENKQPLGFVLVFDNLTKLEKMQRMAAWREVARRIAHEVKNPLTPIQLSAQRLRKRYPDILEEDNSVFDQCTSTIISQVDELKTLVSEFSQFARMPQVQKNIASIQQLTDKTLILYKGAHKHIKFSCEANEPIPEFSFDAEQIGRCLINLIDNAIAVLPEKGKVQIELSLANETETVLIKVADNGPGITKENKLKLFEPYFSTKKTGTGLGLAIVSTIVADHNGYIRVQDNIPSGSVFTIELPLITNDNVTK